MKPARVALLSLVLMLAPIAAHAQSLWMPRDRGSVVLEALRPGVEFVDDRFLTATFFLGLRAPVAGAWLVAEAPYARLKGDYVIFIGSSEVAEGTLGNLYLGVETRGADTPFFGELGLRLPTADEEKFGARASGGYSDVGRFNTFYPDVASIQAAANVRTVSQGGIASRLRLGFAFAYPTKDSNLSSEVYGLYAWQTGYEGRSIRAGVAASGIVLISDDTGNLGSRATTQLEMHGDFGAGRVRPGLEVKLPLGGAASLVSVVYGLSLSVGLGSAPTSE